MLQSPSSPLAMPFARVLLMMGEFQCRSISLSSTRGTTKALHAATAAMLITTASRRTFALRTDMPHQELASTLLQEDVLLSWSTLIDNSQHEQLQACSLDGQALGCLIASCCIPVPTFQGAHKSLSNALQHHIVMAPELWRAWCQNMTYLSLGRSFICPDPGSHPPRSMSGAKAPLASPGCPAAPCCAAPAAIAPGGTAA